MRTVLQADLAEPREQGLLEDEAAVGMEVGGVADVEVGEQHG